MDPVRVASDKDAFSLKGAALPGAGRRCHGARSRASPATPRSPHSPRCSREMLAAKKPVDGTIGSLPDRLANGPPNLKVTSLSILIESLSGETAKDRTKKARGAFPSGVHEWQALRSLRFDERCCGVLCAPRCDDEDVGRTSKLR